jgi:hypothetical protein
MIQSCILLLVTLKNRESSTPAGCLVLFNGLLHHPAVEVSTNFYYRAFLIESHAPGVCIIELQTYSSIVSPLEESVVKVEKDSYHSCTQQQQLARPLPMLDRRRRRHFEPSGECLALS